VIFPRLSELAALKKSDATRGLMMRGVRLALFSVVPLVAFFFALPVPIVRYVLQRGAFSVADTERTARALMGFAAGLPGFSVTQVASFAMIAISEGSAAAKVGALTILLDLPVSVVLRAHWGLAGVALGASVAASLNAALLLVMLQKRAGRLEFAGLGSAGWRLGVSALAAAATCRATYALLVHGAGPSDRWRGAVFVVLSLLAGLGAFGLAGLVLQCKDVWEVVETVGQSIIQFRLRLYSEVVNHEHMPTGGARQGDS
jgi:putative peptidoglycan lipid II flippase